MKILNSLETICVGAGLSITANGITAIIDTTGIPDHCVTEMHGFMNTVARMTENESFSASSMLYAIAPYMDSLIASGCDSYLPLLNSRIQTARVI